MEGLTDQQLNEIEENLSLKKVGFSDDEFSAHESLVSEGVDAKKFLDKPWYRQLLSKEVVKETPKFVAQVLIGTPVKFGTSVLAAPIDITRSLMGKEPLSGKTAIPGLEPTQTFQKEAYDRAGRIIEGKQPLYQALTPFVSVPLAGIETVALPGLTKGLLASGKKGLLSLQKSIKAGQEARKIANEAKILKQNIDIVSPKLTITEMEEALGSGKVVNRIKPLTKTVIPDFSNDSNVVRIANDTKGIFSPNVTFSENLTKGRQYIENTSENIVKPFLSNNPVPFNYEEFIRKMKLVHPPSSFNNNPNAFKTFNRVREEVIGTVAESLKRISRKTNEYGNMADLNDVWNARKILDNKAKEELKNFQFGTPEYTGVKSAVQEMRGAFKDFILDSLQYPGKMEQVNKMQDFLQVFRARGNSIPDDKTAIKILQEQFGIKNTPKDIARMAFFRDQMEKISSAYDAVTNLSTKARLETGSTRFGRFAKKHPVLTGVIKYGLPTAGGLEIIKNLNK